MGVTHSMDARQVERVATALQRSASAIDGINTKFDALDVHFRSFQSFNGKLCSKVDDAVSSFERLDTQWTQRFEDVLTTVDAATEELALVLQDAVTSIRSIDVNRELHQLPKIIIPLAVPMILLLIELAIANAYLGILVASLPQVVDGYSSYLFANACCVLLGLTVSLLWLGIYRIWLSKTSNKRRNADGHLVDHAAMATPADDIDDFADLDGSPTHLTRRPSSSSSRSSVRELDRLAQLCNLNSDEPRDQDLQDLPVRQSRNYVDRSLAGAAALPEEEGATPRSVHRVSTEVALASRRRTRALLLQRRASGSPHGRHSTTFASPRSSVDGPRADEVRRVQTIGSMPRQITSSSQDSGASRESQRVRHNARGGHRLCSRSHLGDIPNIGPTDISSGSGKGGCVTPTHPMRDLPFGTEASLRDAMPGQKVPARTASTTAVVSTADASATPSERKLTKQGPSPQTDDSPPSSI